ncbi:hypothetical protein N9H39_11845, partial [Gammaproteobacteria bacterium]|nr:hypothetical protein [Gammaproteobacteria bacterium]
MAQNRRSGKLAVILHVDVAGSTTLVQLDEVLTHQRIQDSFRRFGEAIARYHGYVRELRGDALLAEFERASDAVAAALAFQADQADHIAQLNDNILPIVRVGIALGEVIVADNTVTGAGVVLAQRVEQLAEHGGVCITGAIHEALPQRMPFEQENLGEQKVKGFEETVRVYRVALKPGEVIPPPEKTQQRKASNTLGVSVAVAAIVLVIAGGVTFWFQPWAPEEEPVSVENMAFPLPDKPSIAVLPFTNMSDDPDQEYFAEGITEDIITGLSKFGLFFVISRNSTFAYKNVSVDVKQVARDLGVQYVLEGSVRKFENRLRITAQLVDAIADKHVWAEQYDRELKDVFMVQDEITQSIVTSVSPEYLSAEMHRAQRIEERNLDAWDAFMRSYWHFLRYTEGDNSAAQRLLRKAIDLDPQQSNYHGLLAVTHVMDAFYGWSESRDASFRVALESAESALALDEQDTLALRSIGLVHFFSKNHDVALSYYERAVAVNPNEAVNRALLGAALGVAGNYDAALEQFEIAMRLSPRDVHISAWYSYLAVAAFVMGRHEE